jgi:hypothetical protein
MASPPKLHPALLGGLFLGVVSALPILERANGCCCLWMAIGGALAAMVMQQNHPHQVSLADGAIVGLLAGLIGGPIRVVAAIVVAVVLPGHTQSVADVMSSADGMTPDARELLRTLPPMMLEVIFGIIMMVFGTVVSTIGGVIGAAVFRRSAPPPPPPDVPFATFSPPPPALPVSSPPPLPSSAPAPVDEPVVGEPKSGDPPV